MRTGDEMTDQLFTHVNGLAGMKEVIARDVVAYRHDGPDTSVDAAYSAKPHSGLQRQAVYNLIFAYSGGIHKGMTADEISLALDLPAQSVSARLNGLAQDRHIRDSGDRRKTRYGRKAIVWQTT